MSAVTRHAFTLTTFEGQDAEYRRRHDEIWPELAALHHRAGLRNFTLFQRRREVIGYYEHHADKAEITLEELEADPLSKRWDEHMKDVIESFSEELIEVWHA